jgi:hypothetical protein
MPIMNDDDAPRPGPNEFSAEEEKAMRAVNWSAQPKPFSTLTKQRGAGMPKGPKPYDWLTAKD